MGRHLWLVLAAAMVLASGAAGQDRPADQERNGRVRAKEPTSVTVRGTADAVSEDRSRQTGFGRKVVSGVRNGAATIWNGAVGFVGWVARTNDDIPSDRQRKAEDGKP